MLDMALDIGVDMVTRFGYYDTPDFWGRKYFDRYIRLPMDKEAEMCEQAGAYLSQQQSEGLTQLVDIYKDMKVHILRDVDPVQGGEDMGLLKRKLGDKKTLMGGLNMDVHVTNASREEADELIWSTLERMAPGGRFMLYPVPGLYGGCPWEKVEWLIESWKKYA
ncbi:MAG: hypothetical protein KAH24_10510 [Holophagae bacterium]|nr:hypothetical protein [Holophagae bacterium]